MAKIRYRANQLVAQFRRHIGGPDVAPARRLKRRPRLGFSAVGNPAE